MRNYCALNVMMDEAIANLTCALEANGMGSNTILIISGDNGPEQLSPLNSGLVVGQAYPFRGYKADFHRGGVSNTAIIHSKLLPTSARGAKYDGQVHITDWLPTLMGRATNGAWTGSLFGSTLDGKDVWKAMTTNTASPHVEIVHSVTSKTAVLQYGSLKYFYNIANSIVYSPTFVFSKDLNSSSSRGICKIPSLMD